VRAFLTQRDGFRLRAWQAGLVGVRRTSLDLSRGGDRLTINGVVLNGEHDIFGCRFDPAAVAALEPSGSSWSGGMWNGSRSGSSWCDLVWAGNTLSGSSWSGLNWDGDQWLGASWGR
jgi:hypothetical protein